MDWSCWRGDSPPRRYGIDTLLSRGIDRPGYLKSVSSRTGRPPWSAVVDGSQMNHQPIFLIVIYYGPITSSLSIQQSVREVEKVLYLRVLQSCCHV
jgi:hypothetical protein